jgi:hypothetical protein
MVHTDAALQHREDLADLRHLAVILEEGKHAAVTR